MTSPLEDRLHIKVSELRQVSDFINSSEFLSAISTITSFINNSFELSSSLYFAGNGGSYAEALHISAEFSGRFKQDRSPLPAYTLGSNQSSLTAIANDYTYQKIFSREIAAFCRADDTVILLSTSGHSPNIVDALSACELLDCQTILLTSENCHLSLKQRDNLYVFKVPFSSTDTIQEVHLIMLHLVCSAFEPSA